MHIRNRHGSCQKKNDFGSVDRRNQCEVLSREGALPTLGPSEEGAPLPLLLLEDDDDDASRPPPNTRAFRGFAPLPPPARRPLRLACSSS